MSDLENALDNLHYGELPKMEFRKGRPTQKRVVVIDTAIAEISKTLDSMLKGSGQGDIMTPAEHKAVSDRFRPYLSQLDAASEIISLIHQGRIRKNKNFKSPWSNAKYKLPPHIAKVKELRHKISDYLVSFDRRLSRWKKKSSDYFQNLSKRAKDIINSLNMVEHRNERLFGKDGIYDSLEKGLKIGDIKLPRDPRFYDKSPASMLEYISSKEETLRSSSTRAVRELKEIKEDIECQKGENSMLSENQIYGMTLGQLDLIDIPDIVVADDPIFHQGIVSQTDKRAKAIKALRVMIELNRMAETRKRYIGEFKTASEMIREGELKDFDIDARSGVTKKQVTDKIKEIGFEGMIDTYTNFFAGLEADERSSKDRVKADYANVCKSLALKAASYETVEITSRSNLESTVDGLKKLLLSITQAGSFKIKGVIPKPKEILSETELATLRSTYHALNNGVKMLSKVSTRDLERNISDLERQIKQAESFLENNNAHHNGYQNKIGDIESTVAEIRVLRAKAKNFDNSKVDSRISHLFDDDEVPKVPQELIDRYNSLKYHSENPGFKDDMDRINRGIDTARRYLSHYGSRNDDFRDQLRGVKQAMRKMHMMDPDAPKSLYEEIKGAVDLLQTVADRPSIEESLLHFEKKLIGTRKERRGYGKDDRDYHRNAHDAVDYLDSMDAEASEAIPGVMLKELEGYRMEVPGLH